MSRNFHQNRIYGTAHSIRLDYYLKENYDRKNAAPIDLFDFKIKCREEKNQPNKSSI